jgi:hypothetical protein
VNALNIFGGSGANAYNLTTAAGWQTTVNTGTGSDTVNVLATNHTVVSGGSLSINEQGAGNDTVNISSSAHNLNTIQGAVTVSGNSGTDTLNVLDQNDGANQTWSLTGTSVTRSGPFITYGALMSHVLLFGGSEANTYNVSGTGGLIDTTLNSDGADTLNMQGTAAFGMLTLNINHGGARVNLTNGSNTVDGIANVTVNDPTMTSTLVVDDSGFVGDENYAITSATVNIGRLPNPLLSYSGIASLVVNGGTSASVQDTFDIDSTSANTVVNAAPGVLNRFRVSPTTQWLGANIQSPLTLHGSGTGADVLEFFDTNDPNSETFNFDAVPSVLTLGTTPGFLCSFSGFGAGSIYVLTNGFSSVNDASGTVVFDPSGGPP